MLHKSNIRFYENHFCKQCDGMQYISGYCYLFIKTIFLKLEMLKVIITMDTEKRKYVKAVLREAFQKNCKIYDILLIAIATYPP